MPTTLNFRAGRTILWMKEVLPSGLLMLESKDGRECHEHSKNGAPCYLPIEGTVHPKLAAVPEGFPCFVCMINVNVVGTWHAWGHPWVIYHLDSWVVLVVEDFQYLVFPPIILNDLVWFHHLVPLQMENEELWLRDAIKHETVELILWNLMAKHLRRLRMGLTLHPTYSSLEWHSPHYLIAEQSFIIHALLDWYWS